MIVSSHVLNEVERLAERVIVLIHGRLAAAGGHRAIRDAMDDRPRHVLVRSDDGRRLAASLVALESVAGVTFDATRDGLVIQTVQARELATALPRLARDASIRLLEVRAARRLAREPVPGAGPMTAPHQVADRPTAVAVRRDPRLHAAVVPPAEAVGRGAAAVRRRAAVRPARPRRRRHRRARVRQRRGRGHLRARAADRRARHRRRRARRRGARRHVPLHLAVADADLADRARPLAGRLDRRARHDRAGVRARRGRRRRARERRRRRSSPPPSAASRTSRVFIAIGCITRRTAVWSLAFVFLVERLLGAALTGIAQLSPTWESRADLRPASSTTRRSGLSATASPTAATPSSGSRSSRSSCWSSRTGGCATCASPAPPTDAPSPVCVTAYVVDDMSGDTEREQSTRCHGLVAIRPGGGPAFCVSDQVRVSHDRSRRSSALPPTDRVQYVSPTHGGAPTPHSTRPSVSALTAATSSRREIVPSASSSSVISARSAARARS